MSTRFIGTGNLGADPELKSPVGEDERQVADMRIYFDRPVQDKESKQYEDKGGFWLDVSAWDWLAVDVVRVLKKGMRVKVVGALKHNTWKDESSGEERSKMVLYVDEITLVLARVETVQVRQKQIEATDS
ncbi:MAG: single-stranded DNA-binding protein [Thiotrichaceae bacterium]|nr:single-stranded DNA-binding protein [Thiotrichaceae bacterium]